MGVLSLDLKISRVADWVISGGSLLYSNGVKFEKGACPIGHSVVFWNGEQGFGWRSQGSGHHFEWVNDPIMFLMVPTWKISGYWIELKLNWHQTPCHAEGMRFREEVTDVVCISQFFLESISSRCKWPTSYVRFGACLSTRIPKLMSPKDKCELNRSQQGCLSRVLMLSLSLSACTFD